MQDENPYAPPGQSVGLESPSSAEYVPLGSRAMIASIAMVGTVFFEFTLHGAQIAAGDSLKGANPDLGIALAMGASAIGLIVALPAAIVAYCFWIHRASKNLGAWERYGEFTPGWCVGWFFVPFANLVKPIHAVTEIWKASNPEVADDEWRTSGSSPSIGLWWGTWLVGNIISNVGTRMQDTTLQGNIGLVSTLFTAVAAYACIGVMRGISSRQAALAARRVVR